MGDSRRWAAEQEEERLWKERREEAAKKLAGLTIDKYIALEDGLRQLQNWQGTALLTASQREEILRLCAVLLKRDT